MGMFLKIFFVIFIAGVAVAGALISPGKEKWAFIGLGAVLFIIMLFVKPKNFEHH